MHLMAHTLEETVAAAAAMGVLRPQARTAHAAFFREGRRAPESRARSA